MKTKIEDEKQERQVLYGHAIQRRKGLVRESTGRSATGNPTRNQSRSMQRTEAPNDQVVEVKGDRVITAIVAFVLGHHELNHILASRTAGS
ncbi:unnamed protein product [Aspergillus oryzae var. brunneus]|uniref:Unnamed protein product n=1 Tax=Aspergillus oryzae var. brunneus TaxID=332754 RepID=A0ABQ6L022_ASPOZ|nr:unnamed protein product [Aspergillus oryzae var. brunneus]